MAIAAVSCVQYTPPAAARPREAMAVAASAGKTWDAVIDVFAENNIPVRTMERASGFIATDALNAGAQPTYADCGRVSGMPPYAPTGATYNVLVRGDSTRSTVRVTVRWTRSLASSPNVLGPMVDCSTRGVWESAFEDRVKTRAEGRPYTPAPIAPAPTVAAAPTPRIGRIQMIFALGLLGLVLVAMGVGLASQ